MSMVQIYTQNTSASSMYPSIFWIIWWYTKSLYYKKYPLTTKTWHQTNTVILFGCKMNWLLTICISKQGAEGFTIGIRRLHTYAHFFPIIFQSVQNFSDSHNFILLKNLLIYIWSLFVCCWKKQILYCWHLF